MSICEGCRSDDIYGSRRERKHPQVICWLCRDCRARLLNLPALPERERDWLPLPLAGLFSATLVMIATILAIGAHL